MIVVIAIRFLGEKKYFVKRTVAYCAFYCDKLFLFRKLADQPFVPNERDIISEVLNPQRSVDVDVIFNVIPKKDVER